jgi:hypothetical protein
MVLVKHHAIINVSGLAFLGLEFMQPWDQYSASFSGTIRKNHQDNYHDNCRPNDHDMPLFM